MTRTYAEVTGPFAGLVVARSVEPGNLATPGTPLLTIEREGAYRLEASVDESHLSAIRVGQAVSVTSLASIARSTPGFRNRPRGRRGIARLHRQNRPAPAESLRSGLFGRAGFQLGSRSVLAIPAAAVSERGQLQSVFMAEDGVAQRAWSPSGLRSRTVSKCSPASLPVKRLSSRSARPRRGSPREVRP